MQKSWLGLVVTKMSGLAVTVLQPTPAMLQPTPISLSSGFKKAIAIY